MIGNALYDVSGSSDLATSAAVSAKIDLGLDLSTPATVGALGVFIQDDTKQTAVANFDSTGKPGAAPARYGIAFKKSSNNGRYYFSGSKSKMTW